MVSHGFLLPARLSVKAEYRELGVPWDQQGALLDEQFDRFVSPID